MKIEYLDSDRDPTQEEFPLEGPTLSGCLIKLGIFGLGAIAILLVVAAFIGMPRAATAPTAQMLAQPTPAPISSATVYPTYTPYPTWTPNASGTPAPTFTVTPTATETPIPSLTPIPPGMIATWTPGPWMLTRFADHD